MKAIMFNSKYGLMQAVLNGQKTITRRVVPKHILNEVEKYQEEYYNGALATISEKDAILAICTYEHRFKLPYQVGEIVAIAQAYEEIEECIRHPFRYWNAGWHNKMFVKADFMPHHIKITNVRIERLQEISDKDCKKEGIQEFKTQWDETYYSTLPNEKEINRKGNPRLAYASLINKLSGKKTWEQNPYVFVYEFELIN